MAAAKSTDRMAGTMMMMMMMMWWLRKATHRC
jgi:hypothetical protein